MQAGRVHDEQAWQGANAAGVGPSPAAMRPAPHQRPYMPMPAPAMGSPQMMPHSPIMQDQGPLYHQAFRVCSAWRTDHRNAVSHLTHSPAHAVQGSYAMPMQPPYVAPHSAQMAYPAMMPHAVGAK